MMNYRKEIRELTYRKHLSKIVQKWTMDVKEGYPNDETLDAAAFFKSWMFDLQNSGIAPFEVPRDTRLEELQEKTRQIGWNISSDLMIELRRLLVLGDMKMFHTMWHLDQWDMILDVMPTVNTLDSLTAAEQMAVLIVATRFSNPAEITDELIEHAKKIHVHDYRDNFVDRMKVKKKEYVGLF